MGKRRVGRTGKHQGWIWKRSNGPVPKMVEEPFILAIAASIFKLLHKWSLAYNTERIHNKLHVHFRQLTNTPIQQIIQYFDNCFVWHVFRRWSTVFGYISYWDWTCSQRSCPSHRHPQPHQYPRNQKQCVFVTESKMRCAQRAILASTMSYFWNYTKTHKHHL